MNVELLRKIQKHIAEEPLRWGWDWARNSDTSPCGTQACIGGWAGILGLGLTPKEADCQPIKDTCNLLDIDENQGQRLFFTWPPGFDGKNPDDAVRRIDHFIKTQGAE